MVAPLRRRALAWFLVFATFVGSTLSLACDAPLDSERPPASPRPSRLSVYSEFLDLAQLELALPLLARHRVALYLAIREEAIESEALRRLLRRARELSVEVRAWLLLPDAAGYWPGETNLAAFDELVQRFWRWNLAEQLGVRWIVVDMEPPLQTSTAIFDALSGGSIAAALPILLKNRDRDAFDVARRAWADAVLRWKRQGMALMVVTFPLMLDDADDGDATIQDVLETPIEGIAWDELSFMLYQNIFEDFAGDRLGPALVYDYLVRARERFGARVSVALGVIGTVGKTGSEHPGYPDPESLRLDVAAALEAGVDRVQLFSLDGLLADTSIAPEAWFAAIDAAPERPGPSPALDQLRALLRTLDRAY